LKSLSTDINCPNSSSSFCFIFTFLMYRL
jgi:hypothetical protein